jgi:ACS family glucarate transporter-like MFS transporter
VLLLAGLASGITYLDRVCLSAAAPAIMAELGLSNMQMAYVFSVFALAYGLFEIPMGWLGDRLGQRKMLTRIVASWSVFTALTGMVWGYVSLVVVRFAFGAAEAGAFPSIARALARWFHSTDRGRVTGIMWMSARFGGAIAPPVATLLIGWLGWRVAFAVFGLVGAIWCLVFWQLYRDDPAQHPAATVEDLAYIGTASTQSVVHTPWKRIFLSGNLWAIFWMYFGTSYGFWFLLTWLPTYLIRQHKLSAERSGFYAALPLAVGGVSCLIGGALSDWLVRRLGSLLWGRRLVGLGGYLLAAAGFAAASFVQKPLAAVLCLTLAEAGLDLAVPVAWAACLEVGGSFGGTATGFMNSGSSISAFISPLAAAWLYTRFGSFDAMFMSAAAVYLISGLLWLKIDAAEPLIAVASVA